MLPYKYTTICSKKKVELKKMCFWNANDIINKDFINFFSIGTDFLKMILLRIYSNLNSSFIISICFLCKILFQTTKETINDHVI